MAKRRKTQVQRTGRVIGRVRTADRTPSRESRFGGPALLIGALVVVAVGVVAFALLIGSGNGGGTNYACAQLQQPQPGSTAANPIVTPNVGFDHRATGSRLNYAFCPPASGPHYNQAGLAPARPGFYGPDAGIGPGSWVHNLEHGYVVALYRCVDGTCPSDDDLSSLREFVLRGPSTPTATACGYQSKVLAARFDDMATPFALLAWDRVLLLDTFDVSVALDFANRWIDTMAREPNGC